MESYKMLEKIMPTSNKYGFEMEDYWVWCGSAILGEDGKYHMFSARWPKSLPFFTGYIVASEIVHAVSATPEGPYTFKEVVLGDRGEQYWDGRMTHNPTIVKYGDKYALFYIGATYKGERPSPEELNGETNPPAINESYASIRIGVAVSNSVNGPWERMDAPILEPSIDGWDNTVVTNPAPCVLNDGSILLYYRSNTPDGLKIGVAKSADFSMKFSRVQDTPLFENHGKLLVEDPFVWYHEDHFEMIIKDFDGICGEKNGGLHMVSSDGIEWEFADDIKAYSRKLEFIKGENAEAYHLERPNILFLDNKPAFLMAALGISGDAYDKHGGDFSTMVKSKTIAIPLKLN